jgi:glycosyltransferase involved in cell wall biosynthesis
MLARAVGSVLAQDLPPGFDLEVVVGVSDPAVTEDVVAARRLAAADGRVRVALGPAHGAAGSRNAAVAVAKGEILAFIDDDCEAQPGWLAAALPAMADADIVQGTTRPPAEVPKFHHAIWVDPPSWLWETSNLVVRRDVLARAGGFNEAWNHSGRAGNLYQFGEDAELGWRMVRQGARPAFVPGALVHHAVSPRGRWEYLRYRAGIHRFPRLFRTTPEARRVFYRGYFVNRRHVVLAGTAAAAMGAAGLRAGGRRGVARTLELAALAAYLSPARAEVAAGDWSAAAAKMAGRAPEELVEFGGALYGSIRWRRLLL